ncbi:SCO family protein [Leptospira biflexa]|uniref:SCO family protein n=2 Tax=Leptospira biflexa TaxID=172 RepID=UPI0010916F2A|nr:SCO family protein [Leptospira biflexa]TGM42427.1 SCO family protein [Leptospira biflexa]TGM44313.1 SCO family protein [Leptospira biflexa]
MISWISTLLRMNPKKTNPQNHFFQKKVRALLPLLIFLIALSLVMCKETESKPEKDSLPYFLGKDFDPVWTKDPGAMESLKQIPEGFQLTNHLGHPYRWKDHPKPVSLVVFFYATCRGICPLITKNIIQIQPELAEFPDLEIHSISINPKEDTPSVLSNYRKLYKIQNPNWFFHTGEVEVIESFAKSTCGAEVEGFSLEKNKYEFVHTENIFLFDGKNYLRGIYRAKGTGDIQRLVADLRLITKKQN